MSDARSVEVGEAQRLVLAAARPLAAEQVPLERVFGRVLAQDVQADADVPGFSSAAMDGFAVRAQDTAGATATQPVRLLVAGESRAGHPTNAALSAGQAIAISTGAQMPSGADAVVRVERTGTAPAGSVDIRLEVEPGTDHRGPGSDIAAGSIVLHRGARLGAAGVGALAALGNRSVACHTAPTVAVIATGDELAHGDDPPGPGRLHDSNSHALAALTHAAGATVARRETVGDDPQAMRELIARIADGADVLVLSGGVSRGTHDHVRPSLEALGAGCVFWGINVRPGSPTWFGVLDGTLVFALPGNPVAAITTFALLVAPALAALQGLPQAEPLDARLDGGYEKPAGVAHMLPCRLRLEADGLHALPTHGAGVRGLSAMLSADCVAVVPAATELLPPGGVVRVAPLPALGGGPVWGGSAD